MKSILFSLFLISGLQVVAQEDAMAIQNLLATQTATWNKGDLDGFMQTYWRNDSLLFVGKSGATRGWQKTLDNYKRGYPDKDAMGQLAFDILEVRPLSPDHYFVVGKWMLKRKAGDLSGHYTLLMRKIAGSWKIIADHSS